MTTATRTDKKAVENEPVFTWSKDIYQVSTDRSLLDIDVIHQFLTQSHWAKGIDKARVRQSINNSLCFGLYRKTRQIGFTRVITDFATFGYLCDVFIMPAYRGAGLGRWLMGCCLDHPLMSELRRIMLVTTYAPWLYEKMGYEPINKRNFVWSISRADIYLETEPEGNTPRVR
ncbi:GNAT family N-acetyltransferase [Acerihabitans arboris]|uniref:GNAT family N-acetyltransferase n=1 Tax=Acerihabitans arboris TaxID=2691583 RepID=A0A845SLW8_9GAMM|nr:GNAT family N-acetyltransferase [Acerihabitans arboris]NDL64382.1 GNAT family N-acetyltransferase [Acerihabitans arboris]